jgi:hypothetical protein
MRYLTLAMLLSGVLPAQTQNWRPPDWQQYFKQFKLPEGNPPMTVRTAPRKCAIPLINVLKKDPANDRMVFHVAPSNRGTMAVIPPPAPSCDDVR